MRCRKRSTLGTASNRTFSNLPSPVLNMEKDMSLQMSFSQIKADETKTAEEKLMAMTKAVMSKNGSDDFRSMAMS